MCTDALLHESRQHAVSRALVGSGFIAVQLKNGNVGLCANIADTYKNGCEVFPEAGTIAGSRADMVLKMAYRDDFISRELALATLNALIGSPDQSLCEDVFDLIEVMQGDRVTMVGLIEPVAEMLYKKGCEVSVFENRTLPNKLIEPFEMMPERMRDANIVILSGTTLINDTIDDIMAMKSSAREVILMGPSTPMMPHIFAPTPITRLAGTHIIDGEKAFTLVMEGGGTRALHRSGAMEKVVLEVGR